jgi:hypothetical protein
LNVHNPDTASDYWLMPFTVQAGLRITLAGRYPASRYMSFAVYTSHGTAFTANGVGSTLTDYQIVPDPGSVNPWQHPAPAGGQFTVTLGSDVTPGQPNTLPLAPTGTPAGTTGLIFLRIYAAAQPDPAKIALPAVTFRINGAADRLPACPFSATPRGPAVQQVLSALGLPATFGQPTTATTSAPSPTPRSTGTIVPFAAFPSGPGGTIDTDIAYLSATAVPPRGDEVLVIRARAPTTPSGTSPRPWPAPGYDMRYWSICIDLESPITPVVINHLAGGQVDEGCRYDSQIALGRNGDYTIVIGTETQRAAIEAIPGATFLPLSTAEPTQAYKLNLRNMLPAPGFAYAAQDAPANGSPAAAQSAMGPYYPRLAICPLTELVASGSGACPIGNP